jgi:glutamate racemase
MMPEASDPIGMFDSGVGGLAVLAEVRRLLPAESVLYYADSLHFPYGHRSPEEIRARADEISRMLLAHGAKLIVVACNSATSAAVANLRDTFPDVAFVGMEPALKPAAERTERGVVALLTTPATARGDKLAALIDRHGHSVRVAVIEAPGLAEAVEHGDDRLAAGLVQRYAGEVRREGADVLALGCTHYAFLRRAFERALPDTRIIEPSEAVARHVASVLDERGLRNPETGEGRTEYLTSGDAEKFAAIRERLLRKEALAG